VALDRHNIEKKDFPLGARGYDPEAVDAHLSGLADEIAAFKDEARRRTDTVASSASDRVRTIVEAAEHSASEIQHSAEDDARELREEATSEANTTRENAHREAREYLDKVSASTSAMLERLNAMEQEMHAMIESVRTGSGRLTADLQQLENGLTDVSSAIAPRPAFVPDEPLPGTDSASVTGLHEPASVHEDASPGSGSDELAEPQFAEGFAPPAEEPVVEATPASEGAEGMPQPEAAELHAVAGDGGHSNGFEQAQPAQQHGGDVEGARLIALNMALNRTSREDTARYLTDNFHLADVEGLLDEVYASIES
jgi:cell division septum initiation protein DivIVA